MLTSFGVVRTMLRTRILTRATLCSMLWERYVKRVDPMYIHHTIQILTLW